MMRAVIFANGELSDPPAVRALLQPDDWIVAADGGTVHALTCGRVPDLVIGDMDSIPTELQRELAHQETHFILFSADKDETDLELALLHVANQTGISEILIVAAFGGRLDQTLANIQLLAQPELASLDVRISDGNQTARLIRWETTIQGQVGDLVSLLPLGGDAHGVRTAGLAWPLEGETLHLGQARGMSNVMTGSQAHIQLEAGQLICIHQPNATGR